VVQFGASHLVRVGFAFGDQSLGFEPVASLDIDFPPGHVDVQPQIVDPT
jgi:hypothetical protein